MDRRRFVPLSLAGSNEFALEHRTLLSTTSAILGTTSTNTTNTIPENLHQRLERIQNLPFFMNSFSPNRPLPSTVISPIQDDLRAIISRGHSASKNVLHNFNTTIRSVAPHEALSQLSAKSLVNAFHSLLVNSGINDPVLTKFTNDMQALAKLDSNGPNPTIIAINDFGTIAQLTEAMAQPFKAPGQPSLIATDLVQHSNHVTRNHTPTFAGNAPDAVQVRLIDHDTGQVLGVSKTVTNGRYQVTVANSLPDGKYTVQAQIQDNGYLSLLSPRYVFKVTSYHVGKATPSGPK